MREEAGGGGGTRDTESKTRTPHKDVGNNRSQFCQTFYNSLAGMKPHNVTSIFKLLLH